MKGKENKGNNWRRLVVGVFAVSLFVAFTTAGLADTPPPTTVNIESSQMMMLVGQPTMFNLEAHAMFQPFQPVRGKKTITFPDTPPDPCMAMFTGGTVTSTMVQLVGQYEPTSACSAHGLSGAYTLNADTSSGTITLLNADGATIATGMGKVVINNAPLPT